METTSNNGEFKNDLKDIYWDIFSHIFSASTAFEAFHDHISNSLG